MFLVTCIECGTRVSALDAIETLRGYYCDTHDKPDFGPVKKTPLRVLVDAPSPFDGFPAAPDFGPVKKAVEEAKKSAGEMVSAFAALAAEHGFTDAEDGSEDRYHKRKARLTSARHVFWWLVHNNVAHPLIGLVPRRFAFKFHDWTSRKLHGR